MKSRNAETKNKKTKKESVGNIMYFDGVIKPDDQLVLSPDDLGELFANALYIREPSEPHSQVIFNNQNKQFMLQKIVTKCIKLIDFKSALLHCDSTEASIQTQNEQCRIPEDRIIERLENVSKTTIGEEGYEESEFGNIGIEENLPLADEFVEEYMAEDYEMGEMDEFGEEESLTDLMAKDGKEVIEQHGKKHTLKKEESIQTIISLPVKKFCAMIKLKNEFNFFSRYTKTKPSHQRHKNTQTTVTRKKNFEGIVLLSEIYDAYNKDYNTQKEEKEREKKEKLAAHKAHMKKGIKSSKKTDSIQSQVQENLLKAASFLGKIVNINVKDGIAQDFRYYEDPSDQFRGKGEGTLMLMWTMIYEKANTLFVTDISWSPDYFDLFAVTLAIPQGNLPFNDNPDEGHVCLWSLKNSSYPEYVTQTHCGAMCTCFHPNYGFLLAVGLRDGSLGVYNISLQTNQPQYKVDHIEVKHTACVRQVVWCKDLPSGELNFFSVSEDGTVCQWILMESELIKILRMSLVIDVDPETEILSRIETNYYARGTTITFNPKDDDMYLVGTVEGFVYKCNTKWINYVRRFKAHCMPVNRIDYNKFDSKIYLTCSEDFIVKLWEDSSDEPMMIFDLQTSLSDVCWSPFSSTVFSVLTTTDCRVVFYDLDVSLNDPVCDQLVYPANKYRLLRVAFDKRVPIILIGSSRCTLTSFKLSPNFRTTMKPTKKDIHETPQSLESEKLHKILDSIRE